MTVCQTKSALKNKLVLLIILIIDQFWCIKILSKTIDLSLRLWRINYRVCEIHSPGPYTEVYCVMFYYIWRLKKWNSNLLIAFSLMASNTKCSNLTQLAVLLYIEFYNSFLIGRRCTVNFRSQCQWCHNCRLYNNHLKDTRGEGIQSKLLWQQWLSRSKPTGAIYSVPPLPDFSIYLRDRSNWLTLLWLPCQKTWRS